MLELKQYMLHEYPQENVRCDRKEFKNMNNIIRMLIDVFKTRKDRQPLKFNSLVIK